MKRAGIAAAGALLGLAACASQPARLPGQAFSASQDSKPDAREAKIVDLLASGDLAPAKVEVQALIAEDPDDREAKVLLAEIEQDPKTLLGTLNFELTAKAGDSFAGLAERYMHDRALAYALARYNGVTPPNQPTPGQTVLIPGSPANAPRAEAPAPRRREPAEPHAKAEPAPKPAPKPASKPAEAAAPEKPAPAEPPKAAVPPPPAKPAAPRIDPGRAAKLRSDALVLMNKGDIGQAVVVLRQAAALDPDSAPIKADLDRALRIQHGAPAPAPKP